MDNPRPSKFSRYFFLLFLLGLPFQNCSVRTADSDANSSYKGLYYGGNGEGYTGKLDGMYASLDTTNQCGGNSGDMYQIKDEIKAVGNQLFYMVKDCIKLSAPQPIEQPRIAAVESSGAKFVLGQQMFQQGEFIGDDVVYSHQFADFFCSGAEDIRYVRGVKRFTELTVFMGWQSLVNIPGIIDQSIRRGYLRVIDVDLLSGAVIHSQVYGFDPLMHTFVTDPTSGARVISIYNTDGANDISMTFVEVDAMSPFKPSALTYALGQDPVRSALPVSCYRTY